MTRRKLIQISGCLTLLGLLLLAACQSEPQVEVVEVTRVVTETVVETVTVEGEVVEVTRVVVETAVVEPEFESPVEEETAAEEETAEDQQTQPGDSPFSRGSEGDAIPLPTPVTGPKVEGGVSPLAAAEAPDEGARAGTAVNVTLAESSRLTAGEVDDNLNEVDYLAYLQAYTADDVIPLDVSERYIFQVIDAQGQLMPGVLIQITVDGQPLTELRTHGNGTALFFPRMYGAPAGQYQATVISGEQTVSIPFSVGGVGDAWQLFFPEERELITAVPLDILFLVDATGSMDDEIRELKDNMVAIAMQISALPSQPDVRFSLVTYRDRTDDFLVNTVPFTADLETFVTALAEIEAGGGGDYPEDLHAGLASALYVPDWRLENAVSLIFLIADAPPHLDYPHEDDYIYHVRQAIAHGIKIIPIASSGLDAQGEYIFRQLAQMTNGRFIFLTDDHADETTAESDPSATVANYTVAHLDELIVQIVQEELAPLSP